MTTHEICKRLTKQIKSDDDAIKMWDRIYQAYKDGKIGTSQATDLGMWLASKYKVTFQ